MLNLLNDTHLFNIAISFLKKEFGCLPFASAVTGDMSALYRAALSRDPDSLRAVCFA